jgi:transcriptional regulator GlxA family with amidase domain
VVLSPLGRSTITISRSQIEQAYEPDVDIPEISKARVEAGIEFLGANFHRKIALDEIAAVVNISVEHFSRIFKIETGITPIDYLIKLRIEKASQLLKSSFLSVKEVMASVGYNSKGHFTHHFKRQFGITPSEYRKRFFRRR